MRLFSFKSLTAIAKSAYRKNMQPYSYLETHNLMLATVTTSKPSHFFRQTMIHMAKLLQVSHRKIFRWTCHPDFIAEYAKLPLLPPNLHPASYHDEYIYGANFASAGAGALVETRRGTVIDLKTQASYFKQVSKLLRQKLRDEEAKALLARAVYIINVGGNDYSTPFLTNSSTVVLPYPQQEFVDVVIGNISSVIQEIYEEGGRKFGLLNVGPLNCFPILRM